MADQTQDVKRNKTCWSGSLTMSQTTFDIDPELLSGFVDDSLDDLDTLDSLFVTLEAEPGNIDIINSIFRPVHSIKGNSAFFGLMKLKKLAHELETLLDLARTAKLVPSRQIISILLAGMDQLKVILIRTRDNQDELEDPAQFDEFVKQVVSAQQTSENTAELEAQLLARLEKLRQLCTELESTHLQELATIIDMAARLAGRPENAAETVPPDTDAVPEQLRQISNILAKPFEGLVSDNDSNNVMICLNELKKINIDDETAQIIDTALDEYHTMVDTVGFDSLLCELLQEKIAILASCNTWATNASSAGAVSSEPSNNNPATDQSKSLSTDSQAKNSQESQKTMRVAENSIDSFLGYVGELIVIGEMYNYLQRKASRTSNINELATEFKRVNETFYHLSNSLQKSIMEIRKVPVKILLQKGPRMVRDIASTSGKKIAVELKGEHIRVDKRLIETLDAPLTHMIRNAADHGIETPAERQAAGKPEQGKVSIEVTETDDDIVLSIVDDGKGLDYEAIKAKAVKLGILEPDQPLANSQVTDLLFTSGVSTAEKVTDVSGRGVGMDVVKRNITDANGKITISSEAGKGSQFNICLPKAVTTQIIDGYIVKLDDNRYVIPLDKVREVFRSGSEEIDTVIGRGECVMRHGNLLPILRIFGSKPDNDTQNTGQTMVTLETTGQIVALYVNEVIGIQRVVLKELIGLELESDAYTAAAVMGDGTVAMVLNTEKLSKAVCR